MKRSERASQIWPVLVLCAKQRQVLTYDLIGKLIGVPRHGLGQLLEPIQSYCLLNDLPPLSSLVVGSQTGMPGEGFIAAADLPAAQAKVFAWPWLEHSPPNAEDLESAAHTLPSNGKSLILLRQEVAKIRG